MKKALAFALLLLCAGNELFAQENALADTADANAKPVFPNVYNIKPWIDIPVALAADAWSLYGMSVIYGRDNIPASEIMGLNKNNINKFDRPITDNYSLSAKKTSDLFFYGSMPLPLFLLIDKKIRKDGLKIGLLYLEAMGITGTLYTSAAMIANRFRPYSYNDKVTRWLKARRGGSEQKYFSVPTKAKDYIQISK